MMHHSYRPFPRSRMQAPQLFAILFGALSPASAEHYRVYFLGGQSNGNGRGDAAELDDVLGSPQADVRFYWHRTQVTNNVGHLEENTWIDLAPGSGHGTTSPVYAKEFGSEISFGRTMADADPETKIAIIKYTHGGTNLHTQWAATGDRYASFVATAAAGLVALEEAGDTYDLGGMIWHQGESDAGSLTNANAYEANLTDLISRVRDDVFGGAKLPFIVGSLSNSQNSSIETLGSAWYILRQAQEAVAADGVHVGFVNTDGYPTRPGEAIHFSHEGQLSMGRDFAAEMLRIEALPSLVDSDRDGLSDTEEGELGTNPNEPDTDRDGQDDLFEVNAGTDPLNGSSSFKITGFALEDGQVTLSWPSQSGREYEIEMSNDLIEWQMIESRISSSIESTTSWSGSPNAGGGEIIASYQATGSLNGNFDTSSFDSIDSISGSTASRLRQNGSLTGGGANSFILGNALFDTSDSGSPGFNLAGAAGGSRSAAIAAGDVFSFTMRPDDGEVSYDRLSFFSNQFGTSALVDVSYTIGGVETFVLEGFSPPVSNAAVEKTTIDFENFTSSEEVSWSFYLYGAANETHGIRFDDIALFQAENLLPEVTRYYRIRLK